MKKFIVLVSVIVMLSGCGNNSARYNFSGSSDKWDVFYIVNISNGDREEKNGTIKFTGGEEAPETVDYKIETNSGGSEGTGITLIDGVGKIGNGFCSGCAVIQEDEAIKVEITWDGQTENLILINEN